MKTLVTIIDLVLIVPLTIYTLSLADTGNDTFFYVLIIVITILLLNFVCINFSSNNGWLNLYFKRKALEEKKKIDELSSK